MGLSMYLSKGKGKKNVVVGEWRKNYSINDFFIENMDEVVNGHDRRVSRETIDKLLFCCMEIKNNPKSTKKLLPIDENHDSVDYFEDLNFTIELLQSVLNVDDKDDFFYGVSY